MAAAILAVALTLLVATALSRYFGFRLKQNHIIVLTLLAILFGALFATSPPLAMFIWAVFANVAIVVFVLAATRRYLEDHPKGGRANHRDK